jgi:hypothetical protein
MVLATNTTLKEVLLVNNLIGPVGTQALAAALLLHRRSS